jgi:hypothetical protein
LEYRPLTARRLGESGPTEVMRTQTMSRVARRSALCRRRAMQSRERGLRLCSVARVEPQPLSTAAFACEASTCTRSPRCSLRTISARLAGHARDASFRQGKQKSAEPALGRVLIVQLRSRAPRHGGSRIRTRLFHKRSGLRQHGRSWWVSRSEGRGGLDGGETDGPDRAFAGPLRPLRPLSGGLELQQVVGRGD